MSWISFLYTSIGRQPATCSSPLLSLVSAITVEAAEPVACGVFPEAGHWAGVSQTYMQGW